jgi:hypothetical protein
VSSRYWYSGGRHAVVGFVPRFAPSASASASDRNLPPP